MKKLIVLAMLALGFSMLAQPVAAGYFPTDEQFALMQELLPKIGKMVEGQSVLALEIGNRHESGLVAFFASHPAGVAWGLEEWEMVDGKMGVSVWLFYADHVEKRVSFYKRGTQILIGEKEPTIFSIASPESVKKSELAWKLLMRIGEPV